MSFDGAETQRTLLNKDSKVAVSWEYLFASMLRNISGVLSFFVFILHLFIGRELADNRWLMVVHLLLQLFRKS